MKKIIGMSIAGVLILLVLFFWWGRASGGKVSSEVKATPAGITAADAQVLVAEAVAKVKADAEAKAIEAKVKADDEAAKVAETAAQEAEEAAAADMEVVEIPPYDYANEVVVKESTAILPSGVSEKTWSYTNSGRGSGLIPSDLPMLPVIPPSPPPPPAPAPVVIQAPLPADPQVGYFTTPAPQEQVVVYAPQPVYIERQRPEPRVVYAERGPAPRPQPCRVYQERRPEPRPCRPSGIQIVLPRISVGAGIRIGGQ